MSFFVNIVKMFSLQSIRMKVVKICDLLISCAKLLKKLLYSSFGLKCSQPIRFQDFLVNNIYRIILRGLRRLKKEEIDTRIIDACGHACLGIPKYG